MKRLWLHRLSTVKVELAALLPPKNAIKKRSYLYRLKRLGASSGGMNRFKKPVASKCFAKIVSANATKAAKKIEFTISDLIETDQ